MTASEFILVSAIFCFTLSGVNAGDYCLTNTIEYCDYGCCGDYPNTECCSIDAGVIVGIVIGAIICVGFIACVIGLCIYLASRHRTPGHVVQAAPATVICTAAGGMTTNQVYGGPGTGPAYIQTGGYVAPQAPTVVYQSGNQQGVVLQPPAYQSVVYHQSPSAPPAYSSAPQ